ncbi:MAG: dienelactone hydrolase family protein [Burkholderiales bacterium]|nr:dienelactone hydrolase family protein [Burkholderiales bacterium]
MPAGDTSRRGFVVGTLAAGFALAVQPVMAQTAITTSTDGLEASDVKIPAQGGDMPAYRARPVKGKNWPTILVVQEIFGVHEYIKDVCRRLAKQGYMAIAPELFARYGDPRQYSEVQQLLRELVSKIPDGEVLADLDACVAWAQQQGGDTARLGITGFCWGGRITWLYCAHQPKVKAGVAWYGRLEGEKTELTPQHPIDVVGELKAPVLGLYGGADAGIPQESVERMRQALAAGSAAAKASEFKVYKDAPHAFHADHRPSFRREEATDGWKRMREWFKKKGV